MKVRVSSRHLTLLLKLTTTAVLLWFVAQDVDANAVVDLLASANMVAVAVGIAVCCAAVALGGLRWHILLFSYRAGILLRAAITYTFVGQFINAALPSTIGGDIVRGLFAVRSGARSGAVIVSLALDRALGVSGAILLTAAMALPGPAHGTLPAGWETVALWVGAALVAGIVAALALQPLAWKWQNRAKEHRRWVWLTDRLPELKLHVPGLCLAFAVSLGVLTCTGAALAAADWSLGSAGLGPTRSLLLAGPVLLATALPLSVAGWGVREAVLVTLYEHLHLAPELGLATSVLFGLLMMCSALPGAFLWIRLRASRPLLQGKTAT